MGTKPLSIRPIAHAIWDPFRSTCSRSFTRGGASGPVNIATWVYRWWYTIGMRSNQDLYIGSVFLALGEQRSFRWLASPST
jgi:photosystem I P700 chlorophyll a apoprotein A2